MLIALRDEVIVMPVYEDQIGDIFIPEGSTFGKNTGHGQYRLYDGFVYGVVVSVGPRYKETFNGRLLRKGDKVIWRRHEDGTRLLHENKEYLILKAKWVGARYAFRKIPQLRERIS